MKTPRRMVWGLLGVVAVAGAFAQQPAPDLETLREKAEKLTSSVRRAEQEVAFSEQSMLALDTKIEARIGALVDLLGKSKDSPGTDERIAVCRMAAVAGLRRTIALYVAERERRRQHGWDTAKLDQRIDLRLEQMAKVAASYGPGEDAGKDTTILEDYEMEEALKGLKAGDYVGGIVETRAEMAKELEAAVEALTARRDTLKLEAEVTTDPAGKEKLAKEIAYTESLAAKRRTQLADLEAAPEPGTAAMVGVGAASDMEKAMRAARKDLRHSLMELQKLTTARDYQQKQVDFLKKQLAEAKAAIDSLTKPK